MSTPTFTLGSNVTSSKEDTIAVHTGKSWVARVIRVMTNVKGAPDGCAYETAGFWLDPKNPKVTPKKATKRQLWANHLQVL